MKKAVINISVYVKKSFMYWDGISVILVWLNLWVLTKNIKIVEA